MREHLAFRAFAAGLGQRNEGEQLMDLPNLIVTSEDARRLDALLLSAHGRASPMAPLLERELARAELVEFEDVAADIVTMNSHVVCKDEVTGEQHEIELVYPHEADPDRGRTSILAPVGAALLGLSVGSVIDWPVPGGRMARVRVMALPFQPQTAARQLSTAQVTAPRQAGCANESTN